MGSKYYIQLNLKTIDGFETFGCLELGSDRAFSVRLFAGLEGRPADDDTGVLHMDLVEKINGLPMNMQVMACTMEELGRNMKYVARELFKKINLDVSGDGDRAAAPGTDLQAR
ncbi:MAG TPA: hypothetical protein VGR89_14965 [Puia sp.]|nr:hypothetical protein [Puia sp.]